MIENFLFRQVMTLKKYSFIRIRQIEEIKKLNLKGNILDVGSTNSENNVSSYLKNKKIHYLNFNIKNDNLSIKQNLEKKLLKKNQKIKFENVLLFNILEHIYNFNTCINSCYKLTKKGGSFFGSTPFMFRIHPSPNDFFRFTEESLEKILSKAGYEKIKIFPISGGVFITFYSMICTITNKIPFLNNILLILFLILDQSLSFFTKSYYKILPIGYFFSAKKN